MQIKCLKSLYEKILAFWKKYKCVLLPIGIMTIVYVVGISAILRADFNYLDDMGRVYAGYGGWDDYSRYLNNFASIFLHFGKHLADISPLPQLLAAVIVAVSGIIILYVLTGRLQYHFWEYVALIPLGLSPYFLECFSYKYDSFYMAISVLAGVLPLLFCKGNKIVYGLVSFAATLIMCTTYQAASGIFPMFVVLLALKQWNEKEKIRNILKFIGVSLAGYGPAMIIYAVFIMHPVSSYVSNAVPSAGSIIPQTIAHLGEYYRTLESDFKSEWLLLIVVMCVAFVWVTVRDSDRKKIIALPVAILALAVMAILAFGMYPVLETPLYYPRAMYGFGVFLTLMIAYVATAGKTYWAKIVSLVLGWAFVVFAFTYGNALAVQKEYTDFRISQTIEDLKELEVLESGQPIVIQISGTIGHAQVIQNMPQDFQMLNRLVPVTYEQESWWGWYGIAKYYGIPNTVWDLSPEWKEGELNMVADNLYHTIWNRDNFILIELK